MLNLRFLLPFALLPTVLASPSYSEASIAARDDHRRATPPIYNVHPNGNKKKCMQVRGGAPVGDNTVVEMQVSSNEFISKYPLTNNFQI